MMATTMPASGWPSASAPIIAKKGDGVDTQPPCRKIADNGYGKGDDNGDRGCSPNPMCGDRPSKQKGRRARRKAEQRDKNEGAPGEAFVDHWHISRASPNTSWELNASGGRRDRILRPVNIADVMLPPSCSSVSTTAIR